ncbi:MAG: hypothetical protein ACOX6Q_00740 [Candidatus Dojkabacteria bacterium]|jgi:hypothetical protein
MRTYVKTYILDIYITNSIYSIFPRLVVKKIQSHRALNKINKNINGISMSIADSCLSNSFLSFVKAYTAPRADIPQRDIVVKPITKPIFILLSFFKDPPHIYYTKNREENTDYGGMYYR